MKNAFIILLNALAMMLAGYLEYNSNINAGVIPVVFMLLGVINLVLNNGAQAGSPEQLKVITVISLISMIMSAFMIYTKISEGIILNAVQWFVLMFINIATISHTLGSKK